MKQKKQNRILAALLAVAMMFQMLPIQALALDGSGSVTYQEYESDKRKRLGEAAAAPKRLRYKPISR